MDFTLFYNGVLPSNGNSEIKHKIRLDFAKQLELLWRQEPLKSITDDLDRKNSFVKEFHGNFYAPLIHKEFDMYGELEIIMLRNGLPGAVVHSGDIDNRLKTLFDAIRMPNKKEEIISIENNSIENPLYCIFEDDNLITAVNIRSMQYLKNQNDKNVVLIVNVKTQKTTTRFLTMDL